uniref:Complex 1 LYR protein domain-containing protein n=1 Tax=Anas platyrhynchos platyrhynchos TaxID=8840 RepID=A0A493SV61_ANAPP
MAVAFAGLQGGRPHSCSGQPVPEHGNAAFPAVRVKPPECLPVPASCCLFPGLAAIPAPRCTFPPPPQGHSTDPRAPPQLRPPAAKCRPARAAQALGPLGPRSGGRVRGKAPPPLTAPPRLAPPPCPCPCPAAAGAWEASPRSGAAPCAAGGDRRPGREEPPAVGNMAAASRAQVLRLYRALLRESQRFGGYNYRTYAIRRIRDAFRENKNITDSEKIEELVNKAKANLEIIHRQVTIGQLYSTQKLVIESPGNT